MATDSAVGVPVRGMAAEATTEGEVMTNEELIREALGVMHCLGIDNLRAKGAIILLTEALRRAETERDAQAKEFARFKAVAALANSVVRWDSLLNEMHEQKARAQRAEQERDAARAELARLTTPRPIAEAPKDGTWIGAIWEDMDAEDCQRYGPIAVVKWRGTGWEDSDGDGYEPPSHFLPLPVLP